MDDASLAQGWRVLLTDYYLRPMRDILSLTWRAAVCGLMARPVC